MRESHLEFDEIVSLPASLSAAQEYEGAAAGIERVGRNCESYSPFDSERRAILLVAGDKAGNWSKWYNSNIPVADDLFDDLLRILKGES